MIRLAATLTLLAFLAACAGAGKSRLNPLNWFGKDREEKVAMAEPPADSRPIVSNIVKLKVDRMPGGAIVYAYGLPPTQGHWDGELVPLAGGKPVKGTLSFEFRLAAPATPQAVAPQRSREVVVAHFISTQGLAGVRRIEVLALNNRRSVGR